MLRRVSEFQVSEFALYPGGRVHQGELKAGFGAALDYYALDATRDKPGVRTNQAERRFVSFKSILWVGTALSADWMRPYALSPVYRVRARNAQRSM